MKWGKTLPLFLILTLTASAAFASGFRLPEAGVKAMGMGFAFTAQADDPSAIYFNPAGLTQLEGKNIMIGMTYVHENGGTFSGQTPVTLLHPELYPAGSASETQKTLHFAIPNGYFTSTNKETGISWGVGVFSPFGLGQAYKLSTSIFHNQATKIDLKTVVVNPTVAFEINEVLSVGFGIDYMYGMAKLGANPLNVIPGVGLIDPLYNMELEGDGDAWGYNFGLLLKPTKNLRIGANYRSGFALDIKDGDVTITNVNAVVGSGALGPVPANTKGSTTVRMPATFAIGVAYTMGKLTVEADADWTFWSSYKNLDLDFERNTPTLPDSPNPKNWTDVCAIRLGAEYRVSDPLALRAGFVYDPSPVPAETMGPELPDSDRLNYMVGAGYKIGPWTIDVAAMYIDKQDRTVNNLNMARAKGFNGTWTGEAWLAGLDVSYKF